MAPKSRLNIKNFFGKKLRLAQPKNYVIFLAIVLILSALIGLTLQKVKNSKLASVDCLEVIEQVDHYLDESNNTEALNVLMQSEKACSNSSDKIINVQYKARLAVATYIVGDKAQSKVYANKTLEYSNYLSPYEKSKISNQHSIEIYMQDIVNDRYYGLGGLN